MQFNNFTGIRTLEEGAGVYVHLATLPDDGPSEFDSVFSSSVVSCVIHLCGSSSCALQPASSWETTRPSRRTVHLFRFPGRYSHSHREIPSFSFAATLKRTRA